MKSKATKRTADDIEMPCNVQATTGDFEVIVCSYTSSMIYVYDMYVMYV